jgi:dolichol kinase
MMEISDVLYVISLVFMCFLYINPIIFLFKRNLKDFKHKKSENYLNNGFCLMFFIAFSINSIYFLILFRDYEFYSIIWGFSVIPCLILFILFVSSSIWFRRLHPEKIPDIRKVKEIYAVENSLNKLKEDINRKMAHIAFFIILWIIFFIAIQIATIVNPVLENNPSYLIWGIEENSNQLFIYLRLLSNSELINDISFVQFVLIVGYIVTVYGFIMFEVIRHSNVWYFPTTPWFTRYLRKDEQDQIASYVFFFLSTSLIVYFLPPLHSIAILGVSTISDMIASQMGMRFGKKKISYNPNKTKLGRLSATIGGCIIGIIIIGPLYGIIAGLVFYITDSLTEIPLKISDNLLTPVSIGIIFIFINLVFFAI